MTALPKYDRLEALGLWQPAGQDLVQDVIVQVGKATMVIADTKGNPLAHFSLAGITVDYTDGPDGLTRFWLSGKNSDQLAIDDPTMVKALSQIRDTVQKHQSKPKRHGRKIALATVMTVVVGATLYTANTLPSTAAAMLPAAQAAQLGQRMIQGSETLIGPLCQSPEGDNALILLADRLADLGDLTLAVSPLDHPKPIVFPGGHVLIPDGALVESATADVLAGRIIAANVASLTSDPTVVSFEKMGPLTALRTILGGRPNDKAILAATQFRLQADSPALNIDAAVQAFDIAGVSATPYAQHQTTLGAAELTKKDPFPKGSLEAVLPDGAWLGLQAICD